MLDLIRTLTVKGSKVVGAGHVTFRPEKSDGRFKIEGADARSATIVSRITCSSFTKIVAEGG
jgi:hypothetical protein